MNNLETDIIGTAFLIAFEVQGRPIYGLITNHHVLNLPAFINESETTLLSQLSSHQ